MSESLKWMAVLEGATASIVFAVIAAGREYFRDWRHRREVEASVAFSLLGSYEKVLTVRVRNHTGMAITVREVILFMSDVEYAFDATGEPNLSVEEMRKKRPSYPRRGMGVPNPSARCEAFASIPPFASQRYALGPILQHGDPGTCRLSIVVETATSSGSSLLIEVRSSEKADRVNRNTLKVFMAHALKSDS